MPAKFSLFSSCFLDVVSLIRMQGVCAINALAYFSISSSRLSLSLIFSFETQRLFEQVILITGIWNDSLITFIRLPFAFAPSTKTNLLFGNAIGLSLKLLKNSFASNALPVCASRSLMRKSKSFFNRFTAQAPLSIGRSRMVLYLILLSATSNNRLVLSQQFINTSLS